ncbi:MAG: hypothetical protein LBE83_02860 [Propionibacteriaceae bacterium]|nr:hypothetical protein [Propionibacteriaceae bacterium]
MTQPYYGQSPYQGPNGYLPPGYAPVQDPYPASYQTPGYVSYVQTPVYVPVAVYPDQTKKAGTFGMLGMGLVLIGMVVFTIGVYGFYRLLFDSIGYYYDYYDPYLLSDASGGWATMMGGATLVGIAGLVLSIIATATNRGRVLGIVGIVFGVLAPVIGFFVGVVIAAYGFAY